MRRVVRRDAQFWAMPKFSLGKLARTLPRKFSRPAHHIATSHSSRVEKFTTSGFCSSARGKRVHYLSEIDA